VARTVIGQDWLVVTAVGVEPAEPAADVAAAVVDALVVVAAAAVVVVAVVVVVALALLTEAEWAVGVALAAVEDAACFGEAEAEVLAVRASASVAVVVARPVAPRLPSPYTAPHMSASRISASAPTRRRRTFVRRARARNRRATSGA
jgi:hypothetical protein